MGIKKGEKGHAISQETKQKISKANDGNFYAICDYCGIEYHTKKSAFEKSKRHFCSMKCRSAYTRDTLPKEEQPRYGDGYSETERKSRRIARSVFNHYLRDKHIEKGKCEICGAKAEAHHDDYSKPLEVKWFCLKHHREYHKLHDNPELLKGE